MALTLRGAPREHLRVRPCCRVAVRGQSVNKRPASGLVAPHSSQQTQAETKGRAALPTTPRARSAPAPPPSLASPDATPMSAACSEETVAPFEAVAPFDAQWLFGDDLKVRLAAAEAERDAARDAHASLERSFRLKEHTQSERTAELEQMLRAAARDRDWFKHSLADCQQEVVQLRRSEAEAVAQVAAKGQEAEAAVQEQLRLRVSVSQVEEEAADLQRRLQFSEEHINTLEASAAENERELSRQRVELDQLREKVELSSDALAKAVDQHAVDVLEIEQLGQERRAAEVEARALRRLQGEGSSEAALMEKVAQLEAQVDRLSCQVESKESELGAQQGSTTQMQHQIERLEENLQASEVARRDLHNQIQELRGNIRVYCRVRPGSTDSGDTVQVPDSTRLGLNISHRGGGEERHIFAFDRVFAPSAMQGDVFKDVAGLVQSALDGYKVCIFAYGQTGSGKTYTMQGTDKPGCWGLIPRSLSMVFEAAEAAKAKGWTWTLQASFLEVYNESIRDLLSPKQARASPNSMRLCGDAAGGPATLKHEVKHDEAWGTMVTNMTCVEVRCVEEINDLMSKAASQRAVGSTEMNGESSRSHSIFALYLRGIDQRNGVELNGALHLVDLAGSERLDRSGATGERLKEAQNINKSLSSLADVFQAKAEGRGHVPFRNSKLTQLLEPCLSGHGKTLMFVNVGPESANAHETLCSLRFARQVAQCDTGGKPKRSMAMKAVGQGSTSAVRSMSPSSPRTSVAPVARNSKQVRRRE